ncbi:MAG TPA: hypothetical protein PLX02_12940 [Syntrophorhabdaceae bacterium]|nr:hypothetical protein [Syntrophorhabdaceae bacterium]HQM82516.1 hypothetical protein [Syntrophorhabdaceae bacterium]
MNRKGKSFIYAIGFSVFVFLALHLFIIHSTASSQDYQAAYTAVENLSSEIRMNEGAVGQTLSEAMQATHGDLKKWQTLEEKMNDLGRSIDQNLPEIGRNLAVLRAAEPDRSLPHVALGRTFEGNLNMATNKKRQLLDMAKDENNKLNKINQMLAKVDKDLGNAARGLMGATVEGFLPDEISLAGEASIIVLGAYFGPPGIVAVGLAWAAAGTFNSMVNLYYNTKGAADQAKVLGEMKQGLQTRRAELEKNVKTLTDGAREMEQIEQVLAGHEKKMNEYKAKITAAMEGWNEQAKGAFEEKKKKLLEEAKKKASEPKYGGKWTLCNGREISLAPADYEGEVSSMLSQLESYAKAVEDGGDPDNFQAMAVDWFNKLNDQYMKKSEELKVKQEAYNQATNACYGAYNACMISSDRDWGGCYSRYCGCLLPSQEAVANVSREVSRLYRIYDSVDNVWYEFRGIVENATKFRSREFWDVYRLWEEKFSEANSKAIQAVSDVPYWSDQWKERAEKLDNEIQRSLDWGSNIADIRSGLLATASQLKEMDKTVKEAAKRYETANAERMRVSNLAQSELTSLLNKWGRLIGYYYASNFYLPWPGRPAEFIPRSPEVEKNTASLMERVKKSFTLYEPENVKNAQKINWLGLAASYENKAKELSFYTDWVDTYRHRLATAVGALNKISQEQTKQGLYADRGNAGEVLKKELSSPPWGPIGQEVNGHVSKEDFSKLPWASYQSFDNLNVWQKLYAGQQVIYAKLDKEARYYIQARSNRGFHPVPQAVMKPLEDAWKGLRKLCERYDALAKPARDAIGNSPEEVEKAAQPVWETYGKMPGPSRDLVAGEHRRFSTSYNWLRTYLSGKQDALKTTLAPPTNAVAAQLDSLILEYPALYENYRKAQEEAERRMEEARKRAEEEEKKRREEEQKKAEAEKKKAETHVAAVQNLYNQFKQAYESKSVSAVMRFLSSQWSSGDGGSISDLQRQLQKTFNMFDDIRFTIQNLKINKTAEGQYRVNYDVTITSRIYKRNLKHEEKSNIDEEVTIDQSGQPKISRTLGGRLLSVR